MIGARALLKKLSLGTVFKGGKYLILAAMLVTLLFPVFWMLVSSFTSNKYLLSLPPHFIPLEASLNNYIKIFHNEQYLNYFKNSFITAGGTVVVTLVIAVFAGYAFSRYRFRGKNMMLTSILMVQMFPIVAILISLYTFYFRWGMLNTYHGLILADTTFCLPLAITLMKAFFDTLPRSLDESAKIDGAGSDPPGRA